MNTNLYIYFQKCGNIYIYHLLLEIFNFKQHCEDRLYMDFFSLKYTTIVTIDFNYPIIE